MQRLVIKGRIPSKKNSKMAIPMGKRCILIPQKAYTTWHKYISEELQYTAKAFKGGEGKFTMNFYFPDHRRTDTINKAESVLDLLVDNGIIDDDNCEVVKILTLNYMGVDKENPRVEILYE